MFRVAGVIVSNLDRASVSMGGGGSRPRVASPMHDRSYRQALLDARDDVGDNRGAAGIVLP